MQSILKSLPLVLILVCWCANNINSDLKNISDWLTVNKLQFHLLKPKLMVVGTTYNLNTKYGDLSNVISIDNNLVSRVPSNKCLGVLLDEKLTFQTHIEYICKKGCAGIGALRGIKPTVPLCTLATLYFILCGIHVVSN